MNEEQTKKLKFELDQRRSDAKAVMATASGRRTVHRLFERCGLFRAADSLEPGRLQYMAGRRDAALELMELVVVMPEYALMLNEHAKEAR